MSGDQSLIETACHSLHTFSKAISRHGQVAAVIRPEQNNWDWGEGGSVDSTAWYIILSGAVLAATGRKDLIEPKWDSIKAGLDWLQHQDVTGTGLISGAPSTDWMDSSLTRSGRTLNLNVLYLWAADAATRLASALGEEPPIEPADISWRINTLFWPTAEEGPEQLFKGSGVMSTPETFPHQATVKAHQTAARANRSHYISHVVHSLYNENCDVLANLIAVCLAIPNSERSGRILDFLQEAQVYSPFPTRTWARPIQKESGSGMRILDAEANIDPRWHNPPYSYHNGGIWPFVGGFHVVALALTDQPDQASSLLSRLGEANRVGTDKHWGFHEWLDGRTGEPSGAPDQAWNAGMYVLAHKAVEDPTKVRSYLRSKAF